MTTIDEQSPKTVRNSKFTPPPPTPFSSPVGSIVDDDSMNIDPEKAMTTVSGQARRNKRSTVSFSNVEIIELPYTLGDNPSVSSGAPISASWIAQKRTILDLDFFERFRPERRNKRALQLSKDARKSILIECGHSAKDILAASSEASRVRKGRYDTIHQLRLKYQGMVMKPSQYGFVLTSAPRMSPPRSPPRSPGYRPQQRSSPLLDRFSNSGGSDKDMSTMYPSKLLSSRPPSSSSPGHRGLLCNRNFTPIKKKKHPGFYSPKIHSQNTNQFSMVPPKRHPLSPPMAQTFPIRST